MLAYISKTSSKHIHSKLQSKVLQFDIPSRIFHSLIWSMLQLQMTSAQGHMLSLEQHPFPPETRQYIDFKPQKNLSFAMHVSLPNGTRVYPLALLNLNFWLNLAFMTPLGHCGCDYCNKCGDAWYFDFRRVWRDEFGRENWKKKSILSSSKPGLNGRWLMIQIHSSVWLNLRWK